MSFENHEKTVAELFERDRSEQAANETRVRAILARAKAEANARDVVTFVFVRMWLAVLEFSAHVYAVQSRNRFETN